MNSHQNRVNNRLEGEIRKHPEVSRIHRRNTYMGNLEDRIRRRMRRQTLEHRIAHLRRIPMISTHKAEILPDKTISTPPWWRRLAARIASIFIPGQSGRIAMREAV